MFLQTIGKDPSNSKERAVIQLISQILNAFNENKYTLGIFIDLSIFNLYF